MAEVGCRAAEHRVASTICHYSNQFSLRESVVGGTATSEKLEKKSLHMTQLLEQRRDLLEGRSESRTLTGGGGEFFS